MEVVWPGNYMMLRHPDAMETTFPEIRQMRQKFPSSEPTAFWIRVAEVPRTPPQEQGTAEEN